MLEKLQTLIAGRMARSVIRKLMILASGFLLGLGVEPQIVEQFTSSGTEILIALAIYVLAQGWSALEKKAESKLLKAATK